MMSVLEGLFVEVEDDAVGAVADRVGPDLDAVLEGALEHGPDFVGFVGQVA